MHYRHYIITASQCLHCKNLLFLIQSLVCINPLVFPRPSSSEESVLLACAFQHPTEADGNFTLETFQLPTLQDDLPALIVETEVPELDTDRLRRAVDESIPKLNAGQRAVFDAVVGCILPGVSSSNLEAPVWNHSAQQNAESRVFLLGAPGGTGKHS